MPLAIAVVTFASVLVVAALLVYAFGGREEADVAKRLESIQKSSRLARPSRRGDLLRDEKLSEVSALEGALRKWPWATQLRDYIGQGGLRTKPAKLLLLSGNLGLVAYLAVAEVAGIVLAVPAAAAACGVPLAFVALKRHRRLRAFELHFPEAIDLIARVVRSGHSLSTALEMIPAETPEPVAGEFRVLYDEQRLGLPLNDALVRLARRVPLMDVRFFVTALFIQRESGGNLGEILDNLSRVIRDRFVVYGEIRARSAQGRLTAAILLGLPPAILVMMAVTNPGYLHPLFAEALGRLMLGVAAMMQTIGALLLLKIVRIEV